MKSQPASATKPGDQPMSTIEPFNAIPLETWVSALMAVSREDFEKSLNYKALKAGRAYLEE
jgi:hypothetical protein